MKSFKDRSSSQQPYSDPSPPYLSASARSRTSVSEASKAVDLAGQDGASRNRPQVFGLGAKRKEGGTLRERDGDGRGQGASGRAPSTFPRGHIQQEQQVDTSTSQIVSSSARFNAQPSLPIPKQHSLVPHVPSLQHPLTKTSTTPSSSSTAFKTWAALKTSERITLKTLALGGHGGSGSRLISFPQISALASRSFIPGISAQDAQSATSESSRRLYMPKSKVKPFAFITTASKENEKGSKKQKTKFVPPKPVIQSTRMTEPEEGHWEEGTWVEKVWEIDETEGNGAQEEAVGEVVAGEQECQTHQACGSGLADQDLAAISSSTAVASSPSKGELALEKALLPSLLHEETSAPVTTHSETASSARLPPLQHGTDETSLPSRYPRQASRGIMQSSAKPQREALFLPVSDDDVEDQHHGPPTLRDLPGSPSTSDPVDRPSTRRLQRFAISPDTTQTDSVPPTQISQRGASGHSTTSLARAASQRNISRSVSYSAPPTDDHIKPSRRGITSISPIKAPQTYGAKSRSMVPPAPAKKSANEVRREKRMRYDHQDAKTKRAAVEMENAAVQARKQAIVEQRDRMDRLHPVSHLRTSSAAASQSLQDPHTGVRLPLRELTSNPDQHGSSDVLAGNVNDPFGNGIVRHVGSQHVSPVTDAHAGSTSNCRADGDGVDEGGDERSEHDLSHLDPSFEPWSRIPRDSGEAKKKRKKRKRLPGYHEHIERDLSVPLGTQYRTYGPHDDGYSRQKRQKSTSMWRDERTLVPASDTEEEEEGAKEAEGAHTSKRKIARGRRSKRNGAWPSIDIFDPSSPTSKRRRLGYEMKPFLKYGDPAANEVARQLDRDGLYIVREGKKGKLAITTGRHGYHRREHLHNPARLKMSRKESVMNRTDAYVDIVSKHSKSSRSIRSDPNRAFVRQARDLPGYVIKQIKTISWDAYNKAYNDERPFPIDQQMIDKAMIDLRNQYFRSNGRNRLAAAGRRAGVGRLKMDNRRREMTIEPMDGKDERIDTVTPSFRPTTSAGLGHVDRTIHAGRRVPRLNFTARTPSPPTAPKGPQKRKVSGLLQPERGEEEEDADWEQSTRPDPIEEAGSSDEREDVNATRKENPIITHQNMPSTSPVRLPLPRGPPMRADATSRILPKVRESILVRKTSASAEESSNPSDMARYINDRLGAEADEIVARFPDIEVEVQEMLAGRGHRDDPIQDGGQEDIDVPFVPSLPVSAPAVRSGAADTVAEGGTGGMMSGAGMTDHLLEALQKTKAMFATSTGDTGTGTTTSGSGSRSGEEKDKRFARNAERRQRIKERSTLPRSSRSTIPDDSQMLLNFKPRHTQQASGNLGGSGSGSGAIDVPPPTARVLVAPLVPSFPSVPPRVTPRLGLSRSNTRRSEGAIEQTQTQVAQQTGMEKMPVGRVRSPENTEFKPPTRAPTRIDFPYNTAAETQVAPQASHPCQPTPTIYQAGQAVPTQVQATGPTTQNQTRPATRSRSRSRSAWTSAARVSTTDKDSSPPQLPSSQATVAPPSGMYGSSAYLERYDTEAPDSSDNFEALAGEDGGVEECTEEQLDRSRLVDPPTVTQRRALSRFVPPPKAGILKRNTRLMEAYEPKQGPLVGHQYQQDMAGMEEHQYNNTGLSSGYVPAQAEHQAKADRRQQAVSGPETGRGSPRWREGSCKKGGASNNRTGMAKIGSQRARQPFRAPTMVSYKGKASGRSIASAASGGSGRSG